MGFTVFDLFGKILTLSDMRNFLRRNSINPNDFETTAALAIRCFLLLVESKDKNRDSEVLPLEIPMETVVVKAEIIEADSPEPIEITSQESNDQDFYMAIPAVKGTNISQEEFKVKKARSANICRGPGCCCNQMFPSRNAKQQHYLEKGCFRCKICGEPQVSRAALDAHAETFLRYFEIFLQCITIQKL